MYATFCDGCGEWADHGVERAVNAIRLHCTRCGHKATRQMRLLPLFIVTGASGAGKSSVVAELRCLIPDWEVFETDILWDSGGDWHFVRQNWLRIAHSIAQSGRPTLLCGTLLPQDIDRCDHRDLFSQIHYAGLHCDAPTLAARLRTRPAWPLCTEAFIAEHQQFSRWLLDHATTAFDPPLHVIDTTHIGIAEVAQQIRDWALTYWPRGEEAT